MEQDRILELPDVALYHLITKLSLEEAAILKRTYGLERKTVFITAERNIARKLGLPIGLSFSKMYRLVQLDPADKIRYLIQHVDDTIVDYTPYILELAQIKGYDLFNDLLDDALFMGRERLVLTILKRIDDKELVRYAERAMNMELDNILEYVLPRVDFQQIVDLVYNNQYRNGEDPLIRTAIKFGYITPVFVELYLKYSNNINSKSLRNLLHQLKKDELELIYEKFLALVKQGYYDYLENEDIDEMSDVFIEEVV